MKGKRNYCYMLTCYRHQLNNQTYCHQLLNTVEALSLLLSSLRGICVRLNDASSRQLETCLRMNDKMMTAVIFVVVGGRLRWLSLLSDWWLLLSSTNCLSCSIAIITPHVLFSWPSSCIVINIIRMATNVISHIIKNNWLGQCTDYLNWWEEQKPLDWWTIISQSHLKWNEMKKNMKTKKSIEEKIQNENRRRNKKKDVERKWWHWSIEHKNGWFLPLNT